MKVSHKVGDVIRIRSDLVVGEKYDHCTFYEGMLECLGKDIVVTAIHEDRYGEYYEIDDDWSVTEPMLEDYEETEPVSIDVSDIL